ncbi:hypothetical protein ACFWB2_31920 [Streptomyces virginiae]|uniref:hypothetical protein n=1 Tax=Streptomyces virginiae TaxID=1961 RepID=UPI003678E297
MPLAYDDSETSAKEIADGIESTNGNIRNAFGPIDVLVCDSEDQTAGLLIAMPPGDLFNVFDLAPDQIRMVVLDGLFRPRGNGERWPHLSNGRPTCHPGP